MIKREKFTKAALGLLGAAVLVSSCGISNETIGLRYKRVHKPKQININEYVVDLYIPSGPMDADELTVVANNNAQNMDEEAQKMRRQQLATKRLEMAREQARNAAEKEMDKLVDRSSNKPLSKSFASNNAVSYIKRVEESTKTEASSPQNAENPVLAVANPAKTVENNEKKPTLTNKQTEKTADKPEKVVVNTEKDPVSKAEVVKKNKKVSLADEKTEIVAEAEKKTRKPKSVDNKNVEAKKNQSEKTAVADNTANQSAPKPAPAEPIVVKEEVPTGLKVFYFPLENLKEAKAYCYIAEGATPDTTYRLMKSLSYNGTTILVTEIYDKNFEIRSITREQVNLEGVFVRDFTTFEVESDDLTENESVDCGVDLNEGLRWNMQNGEGVTLKFNYQNSAFPNYYDVTISRTRSLEGEGSVQFEGRQLKAITLKDSEETTYVSHTDVVETKKSLTYFNKFAEGVGLVEYDIKPIIGNEIARTYRLKDIMTYNEWNAMTRKKDDVRGN